MRVAMPRMLRQVINAVPDVNQQTPSSQAALGIVLSLLAHLLILVLWLGSQKGWIENLLVPAARPPAEMEMVIETVSVKPPPPVVVQRVERVAVPLDQIPQRVDSTGLAEQEKAPKNAAFVSDKNLEAGSQQKPTGLGAVPTVEGRDQGARNVFVQRDARAGREDAGGASKPKASILKLGTPYTQPKSEAGGKKASLQREKTATALPNLEDLAELSGELVFRKVAVNPAAAGSGKETEAPSGAKETGGASPAKTESETLDDLFEEGKEKRASKGGLAENGKVGVDAAKTPMGVFMKSVSRAIGIPWNQLISRQMDSIERGMVEVRIWVTMSGEVRRVEVERSTANMAFVELCLEAVRAARLEAPPPEAEGLLRDGLLPIPFKFNFL